MKVGENNNTDLFNFLAGKFTADVVCQGKEVKEAEFIVIEGTGKP
jgi:hypothetical protein